MKKLIVILILLFSTSAFGCSVCGYYFTGVVPYVPASSSGWWSGVVLTNTSGEVVSGKMDVVGEHRLIPFQISPHSVEVFNIETEKTVYIKISATGALFVTNLMGTGCAVTGNVTVLKDERE